MVALARRRLQGRARVHAADLQRPLDMVADASIDLVVASLVLHYLRDWRPLLAELHRCLAPRGALVFSVHHPITGWQLSGRTGYHRTELVSEQWNWDGLKVTGRMCRRPLSAIFGPLRDTGFLIDIVDELQPERTSRTSDPQVMHILQTMPVFLYIRPCGQPRAEPIWAAFDRISSSDSHRHNWVFGLLIWCCRPGCLTRGEATGSVGLTVGTVRFQPG